VPTKDDPNRTEKSLRNIVPVDPNKPYDMKEIILKIIDDGNFFEVQEHYAKILL